MKLPLLVLAAALALGATLTAPDADPPTTVVEIETARHTAIIEYQDGDDLWRRATVSLRMDDGSVRPWRGKLQEIAFEGLRPAPPRDAARAREAGFPLIARLLSSGHQTGVQVYAPAPRNLKRIWFRGERGSYATVRIHTRHHNPSTHGDDDEEDPPKDPPEEDPPDDDEPGDDDCGPIPAGCEVYNPWTCECDIGLEDPWGDEAQVRGSTTTFGF